MFGIGLFLLSGKINVTIPAAIANNVNILYGTHSGLISIMNGAKIENGANHRKYSTFL